MSAIIRVSVLFSVVVLSLLSGQLLAAEIRVAVASNFLLPIKSLARAYEQQSGDELIISAGSTGKLYAQIINGAPYDLFLAANSREPLRLEKEGYAVRGSRFTYARGKLALWNPNGTRKQGSFQDVLVTEDYRRLALANPVTAPYGAAAMSVLEKLKLDKTKRVKLLRGENVSQAYQFVATGAADLGFVALSQLQAKGIPQEQFWIIDESLHEPILQQAVILTRAREKEATQRFLEFLKSEKGRGMIESFGYGLN